MPIDRKKLLIYAITEDNCTKDPRLCNSVEQALLGGAEIIQLRDKSADHKTLTETASLLKTLCRRYSAYLIVNDDFRAAVEAGADGVHVGIGDTAVSDIRKAAGNDLIIGATAKTVEQALRAESEGADYLGIGALFPSPTKTDAKRITKDEFRIIAQSVKIPAVAIGGITPLNITELSGIGAVGAAVVSAVFSGSDIRKNTEVMKMLCSKTFGGDV